MDKNVTVKSQGIGFCGLLTIAFIVLKLCGVISWSWLWVLAPLWIGWGFVLLVVALACLICFVREHFIW